MKPVIKLKNILSVRMTWLSWYFKFVTTNPKVRQKNDGFQ